ncbi:MAG: ATP-binding protein, partial [Bacteroidales bacterium]|nr:ATP-binding protein [Bacteroidales bacterium]
IENAIKYSEKNNDIDIYFHQNHKAVEISVSSYGPIVSEDNIHKIYNKGFKDPNAQKFSSKGSGIGLYLADIVAKAHNIEIQYSNKNKELKKNNIEMGINKFSIILNK